MTTIDPRWLELVWVQVWQIMLLVAATGVVVYFVGRRHPHLAYALWMVPLAKCLVPFAGAASISLWGWLPAPPLPWHPGARPALITARRLEEIMKRTNMTHHRAPPWCWPIAAMIAVFALPGGVEIAATSAEPSDRAAETAAAASDSKAGSDSNKTVGAKTPTLLKYGDGKADGKKSLGGTGEMIRFDLPDGVDAIRSIKIHASRYGYPKPPDEDFEITLVSEDFSEILHTENAPYRLFKRGKSKWVNVRFKEPVELPKTFWVVLDFQAGRTKGVYVSFDTASGGKFSRIGLAGDEEPKEVDFAGDWMVRVVLARPKDVAR